MDNISEGYKYLKYKKLDKALECFSFSISNGLYDESILNAAGILFLYFGDFKNAIICFKKSITKNDKQVSEYYEYLKKNISYIKDFNMALEEFKTGNSKNVINFIEPYYKKGFITYDGQKLLCAAYYKLGKYLNFIKILKEIKYIYSNSSFYMEVEKIRKSKELCIYRVIVIILVVFISVIGRSYFINKRRKINTIYTVKTEKVKDEDERILNNLSYKLLHYDYYGFERELTSINGKSLDKNQIKLYKTLFDIYAQNADRYYYKIALEYYKKGFYFKSKENFILAEKYEQNNYLSEHILFLTAKSMKFTKDKRCADYYKEYIKKYDTGCYIEEALYDLSLLYFEEGKTYDSKKYAKTLLKNYRNSVYINSRIKTILNTR